MSIRWRLTLWNTIALALVLIGFGGLVYGLLTRALYQGIDRSLRAELQELKEDPLLARNWDERLRYWIRELKEHENIFCVVYDAEGRVYERSADLAADSVPLSQSETKGDHRGADVKLPKIGRQRVLTSRLWLGQKEFIIALLFPLADTDRELWQLLMVLVTAGPMALIVAGGRGGVLG